MRTERLGEEIRHEISEILQTTMRDPRVGMAGVTRVELSPDLAHAKVFVSVLGDERAQEESFRAVAGAAAFIRRELARRLRARRVPELDFRADAGIRHSIRIQQALRELGFADGPPDGGAEGALSDGEGTSGDGAPDPPEDGA